MKKILLKLRKIVAVLASFCAILLVVFLIGRYGWTVMGFRLCQGAGVDGITVLENEVEISGFYPFSFPEGFIGYYAEEKEGKLFVGFNFSALFGMFETGDFCVSIPTKGEITEVYVKTNESERLIWSVEEGAVFSQD